MARAPHASHACSAVPCMREGRSVSRLPCWPAPGQPRCRRRLPHTPRLGGRLAGERCRLCTCCSQPGTYRCLPTYAPAGGHLPTYLPAYVGRRLATWSVECLPRYIANCLYVHGLCAHIRPPSAQACCTNYLAAPRGGRQRAHYMNMYSHGEPPRAPPPPHARCYNKSTALPPDGWMGGPMGTCSPASALFGL